MKKELIYIITTTLVLIILFAMCKNVLASSATQIYLNVTENEIAKNETTNNIIENNEINNGETPQTGDINLYLLIFFSVFSLIVIVILIKVLSKDRKM